MTTNTTTAAVSAEEALGKLPTAVVLTPTAADKFFTPGVKTGLKATGLVVAGVAAGVALEYKFGLVTKGATMLVAAADGIKGLFGDTVAPA